MFSKKISVNNMNDAVKFKDTRAAKPPLSQAFESFVCISRQAVSVLKFLLKPC